MMAQTESVGTALLAEIERVAALRERYRAIGAPGIPASILMTRDIEAAKAQVVGDDPAAAIRALKDLQSWEA